MWVGYPVQELTHLPISSVVDSSLKYASETRRTTSVAHSASTVLADIVRTIVIDKALAIAISLPSDLFVFFFVE